MKVYEVIKRTGEKKFSIDKEKFVDCLSTSFSKDDIEVITAINENYFD